jgi:preprotein translocase subunit SecY
MANAFSVADIRKKLAFTAAMLLLYRLGAYIPAPGVDINAVKELQSNFGGSSILGFLNLFSGGGLSRLSLFALGIMPYITASIILQLLTVVVPSLEKLQKEGEVGQQKITQYTRYLTVALAFAQSLGYVYLFRSFGNQAGGENVLGSLSGGRVLLIVICLTAGCTLLMWLGELITQRGIGNGISLMIFASIASRIPSGITKWWENPDQVFVVMMPFIALAVIVAIVFVQEGQRRIPVQYAKRVVGRKMTSGGSTYLPLRVNMAGVIPVIFAASIMAFPPTVGQLLNTPAALDFASFFNPNGWAYVVGEVFFIVIFTYFYTAVTFNPVDQADNLKKYGGFIPGVRPGRPTAEYLDRILSRLTFPGALYLGAVAALPTILINQTSANFFFGGTSILIVIGVALDTVKQLEAQLMMRNYEGFLK